MTAAELREARHALGLSAQKFAEAVGVESGRTVRRWEAGDRAVPGTVVVLLRILGEIPEARRLIGI